MSLTILCTTTLAVTTTPISAVCPACGTIKKSGKASCCSRGGSWFGKCGGVGNANLGHTWHEGIRACKVQFRAVVGQKLHAFRPKTNTSSDDARMVMDSKAVIVDVFASASANISTVILGTTPITVSANVNKSTTKPTIPPGNVGITNSIGSASAIFITTSSHTSDSASITAREYELLLRGVAHIGILLTTICRC